MNFRSTISMPFFLLQLVQNRRRLRNLMLVRVPVLPVQLARPPISKRIHHQERTFCPNLPKCHRKLINLVFSNLNIV